MAVKGDGRVAAVVEEVQRIGQVAEVVWEVEVVGQIAELGRAMPTLKGK